MSQQLKRHVIILSACAGLITGCAPGDETDDMAADEADVLAQQAGHDAGTHAHDAGHDDHTGHDAGTPTGHGADGGMQHGDGGMQHGDGGMQHGDGGMQHGDEPCRASHPTYRPGLSYKVGNYTIQVVSAMPAPPRQQVPNDWVIKVLDAAGQPLADAKVENPDTFMAVHGHGGAFLPDIAKGAGPGEWKLIGLDFTMRGPWEVSFDLTPTGAARPTLVSLNICVE
ncbi:MAG: FixH family protein [Polyangiales bacterium]